VGRLVASRHRRQLRLGAVLCLAAVSSFPGVGLGGGVAGAFPSSSTVAVATARFIPSADARVEQAHPTRNYGRSRFLSTDGDAGARVLTIIRFKLKGISAEVRDATLRLYVLREPAHQRPAVSRAGNGWTEAGVTWKTRPKPRSAAVADTSSAAVGKWLALDVTPLVRGNGLLDLLLMQPGSNGVIFASREDALHRPTLSVTTKTTVSVSPPAGLRFAYSNRVDQSQMRSYGYNLIDVSTPSEADAVPPGTKGQVWLYDYDNTTCTWEKSDAYITNIVSQLAHDPRVAGFYFSNEPDPFACPNAPRQHRERNALIKSLAPDKYTLIGIDANWRQHFDRYGSMWVGAADYVNYNPYICYERDTTTCDFAWLDHVLKTAQSLPQPYFVALQAFREQGEWRWPTASEEARMLNRLRDPALTGLRGYMTFSWDWQSDPLRNHQDVLAEIQAYNLGKPSPCCSSPTRRRPTSSTRRRPSDPTVVAVGDLCGSPTSCTPTAKLVQTIRPTAVLPLGDNAYEDGTLEQYDAYYDPNWGRFKSITHPTTGNHEYHTPEAAGYFSYFGRQAPAAYYSYNLGAWHLIAIGAMAGVPAGAGSAEEKWLRADLAAHRNRCVLAYWHEPRWSAGSVHGNDSSSAALWRDLFAAHADIVINGHEHNYQRYAPLNPSGSLAPNGIREFVVGTGGWGHYDFATTTPMPQVRNNTDYGVLKLTLHRASYDWKFVPVAGGSFTDYGSTSCR
jgi:calcineurin-like phosphoesterase family protein